MTVFPSLLQRSIEKGYVKKAKVKVKGFLLIFKKKKEEEKPILVARKRNQILNLQNVLTAFYNSITAGSLSVTKSSYTPGIIITTNTGNTISLSFLMVEQLPASGGASVLFIAQDNSDNSYSTTSELLVTQIGAVAIDLATSNLSVTKASDEVLVFQWIITLTVTGVTVISQLNYSFEVVSGFLSGCKGDICTTPCIYYNDVSFSLPSIPTSITSRLLADIVYNTYTGIADLSNMVYISGSILTLAPSIAPTQTLDTIGQPPSGVLSGASMFTVIASPSSSDVYQLGLIATYSSSSGTSTHYAEILYNGVGTSSYMYMYASAGTTEDTCWFLGVQLEFST